MVIAPFIVAALVLGTGLATTVHILTGVDTGSSTALLELAFDSAAVVALGIVILTIIALSGLLVARGRWSRRLALGLVVAQIALVASTGLDGSGWVALAFGLSALGGLSGRWLDGWLRLRPSATGPDPMAVLMLLGLIVIVPAVGVASPAGLAWTHGVVGASAIVLAWGYSNANMWALWGIRLALPVVTVPALLDSPPLGALLLGVVVGAVVGLSWTAPARQAVSPLMDRLPGPRIGAAEGPGGAVEQERESGR